ncbi:MAG: DUF4364 family protein, partial [Negativibacillus sp.]|nr:DUF4364 family protein [Negativibacillus sp.]
NYLDEGVCGMSFNAFVGGVQPGGLTNDFEVKLLVCYLLDSLKQPLLFEQLGEIFQNTGLVNYFEFVEAVSELERTGQLTSSIQDGQQQLALTESGTVTAQTFYKTIPKSAREKALEEAKRLMEIQRCMDKVEITFAPATDGWTLRVVLRDIGSDLLDMSVFLPTEGECLRVKQQIESDPTSFYSRMLGLLMQE